MRNGALALTPTEPLPFVFPSWRGGGWPLWKLAIGSQLYELLAGGRNLGLSSIYGSSRLLTEIPGLRREGLTGGVRYFDALTNDARLVIDTLRSADRAGARSTVILRSLVPEPSSTGVP